MNRDNTRNSEASPSDAKPSTESSGKAAVAANFPGKRESSRSPRRHEQRPARAEKRSAMPIDKEDVSAHVLRHLGWWELSEHYRAGLRTEIARKRVEKEAAALRSGDTPEGDLPRMLLDPRLSCDDSNSRQDELDGLDFVLSFARDDEEENVASARWSRPLLLDSLRDLEDVSPSLKAAKSGEVLHLVEFVAIRWLLFAGYRMRAALENGQASYEEHATRADSWFEPEVTSRGLRALHQRLLGSAVVNEEAGELFPSNALLRQIERCVAPDGPEGEPWIPDDASEALMAARTDVRKRRQQLVRRAQELVKRSEYADFLQERFWTEREGRVVLPLRSDAASGFRDGTAIFHGSSQTGQTAFIEPRELVEENNGLRHAEARARAEEHRIRVELSKAIGLESPRIARLARAVLQLDLVAGRLTLSEKLDGHRPEILLPGENDSEGKVPELDLVGAKHPLMLLRGLDVVPNDLHLGCGQALVISGPNAGGKTVALKTIGLCLLLARAGIRLPTSRRARIPAFSRVITDIGDDQSILANLSTFSAHLSHAASALYHARSQPAATLVLFDEIAVGTDPEQGAALAESLLGALVKAGATVVVTTHYDRLKLLASRTAGPLVGKFVNAAVGFDIETMSPTFQLSIGFPGSSSAFAVARRLGLPEGVVAQAERLLGGRHREMEELLVRLDHERKRLAEQQGEVDTKLRAIDKRERELQNREHRVQEQLKQRQQKAGDAVTEAMWALEEELREQRKALRQQGIDPDTRLPNRGELLGKAKQTLADYQAQQTRSPANSTPSPTSATASRAPAPREFQVGDEVQVRSLGADGKIVAIRGDKLTVQLPLLRTTVDKADVTWVIETAQQKVKPRTAGKPVLAWDDSSAARHFGGLVAMNQAVGNPTTKVNIVVRRDSFTDRQKIVRCASAS